MNGRVYDPVLGRFLSADPFVGDAGDSQEYNRYSYVNNNPLGYTDPSGYFKLRDALKIVAVVIAAVVTAGVAMYAYGAMVGGTFTGGLVGAISSVGLAAGWGGGFAVAAGVGAGFGSAFAGSLLNGGSIGDAFKSGLVGGVIGGITGGMLSGIHRGVNASQSLNSFGRFAVESTTSSAVIGGAAELQGGEFRHGFLIAFATYK